MVINETNKIDIIATRPDSRLVKLVITDHLPWDDIHAHLSVLQDKINTYLDFVKGGHLRRLKEPQIPDAPEIRIIVALQNPPPEETKKLLNADGGFSSRRWPQA